MKVHITFLINHFQKIGEAFFIFQIFFIILKEVHIDEHACDEKALILYMQIRPITSFG